MFVGKTLERNMQACLQLKTTLCITIRKEFVAKATRSLLLDSYGGH